jgi:hypothetical protein
MKKVDICLCDVSDKVNLALFVQKREEWKRCIIGTLPHAVHRQVTHMLWNDTVFRTFNEARRLTIEAKSEKFGFNAPLIRLLDEGFVATQTMSIRRLTDRNFREPEKAVISLVRVIDDIKENTDLVTRENYMCGEGGPYAEPDSMKDTVAWMHWRRKQENFDKLSGTDQDKRERLDKLRKSVLQNLGKELKVCGSVRKYTNKFIAHASDPKTSPQPTEDEMKITLDKLDECYRAIVRVSSFIGSVVLYEHGLGGVPVPQYDQFKNMSLPMVAKKDMDKLYAFWSERCREVEKWDQNIWNERG